MKHFTLFYVILTLLSLTSCSSGEKEVTIIYSEEEPFGTISKKLEEVLERNTGVQVNLVIGSGSAANVDSVARGAADFAVTENYVPYQSGVNSVTVLFPQILHIFYNSEITPGSFEELVTDKRIFIGLKGSGSYRFMQNLFDFFKVDNSRIHIVEDAFDEVDVFAGFNDILSDNYLIGLEDYKIYSFDHVDRYGKGSIAEAIALKFPKVHPYVIPQKTYGNITDQPVLTLSTDAVLIVSDQLSNDLLYEVIRSVFHEKQAFNEISPLVYKGLDEKFNRGALTFPLHEGVRIYLDRDEPGFFERYAELTGVIFSIVVVVISGLLSLNKWQVQRKKDRVDVFYNDLMEIKNRLDTNYTTDNGRSDLKLVKASQNKAFQMLINEDLEANESFRIYMELSKEVIQDIKNRLAYIRKQQQV